MSFAWADNADPFRIVGSPSASRYNGLSVRNRMCGLELIQSAASASLNPRGDGSLARRAWVGRVRAPVTRLHSLFHLRGA